MHPPSPSAASSSYWHPRALAPNGAPRAELSDTTPSFGGFYAAPFIEGSDTDGGHVQLLTGDFNGDGKPDLVRVGDYGNLSVLLNDGKGGFGAPVNTQLPIAIVSGAMIDSAMTADLNGDGVSDLVAVADTNGRSPVVVVALGNNDGTFQPAISLTLPDPQSSCRPARLRTGDRFAHQRQPRRSGSGCWIWRQPTAGARLFE